MFPQTLQRAIGPAKPLSCECAHAFGRFCPRDGVGHVNDALPVSVQREGEIGVLRQRLQAQSTGFINRIFANSADRAGHDGNAIPAVVSAPVQIKTARVFQSLTTRDERAQVADFGMT